MMLWISLGLALVQTADYDYRCVPIGALLKDLGEKSSKDLKADPKIAQEIVFVHASHVTLDDLKTRIATALDARWLKDGNTDVLKRMPAREKELHAEHIKRRRAFVDDELKRIQMLSDVPFDAAKLAKVLKAMPGREQGGGDRAAQTARYQQEEKLFASGPAARLLIKLILACNPNDLASIDTYSRTIFKPGPTRMQYGIPQAAFSAAVSAYKREQQSWSETAGTAGFTEEPNGRMVSDPRGQTRAPGSLTIYGLEVSRGEMASLLNVNLIAYENGMRSVVSQFSLQDPVRKFLNTQMGKASEKDPIVELSPDSKAFFDRLKTAFVTGSGEAPTPKQSELLRDPVKFEPLSLAMADTLESFAKLHKVNLIASLADDDFGPALSSAMTGDIHTIQTINAMTNTQVATLVERDGWATLTPTDRLESNSANTPRAAIVDLMKSVYAKGVLDIRDYSRYAYASNRISRMGMGEYYLMMFDRSLASGFDQTDWDALRLYGSFGKTSQEQLDAGAKFPFSALSQGQKEILARIAFKGIIQNETVKSGSEFMMSGPPVEPTDSFADGLPLSGQLSSHVNPVPILIAYAQSEGGKYRPLRPINVWTLADYEVKSLTDPQLAQRYSLSGLVGYAPGEQKVIVMRLELARHVWKEVAITLADTNLDPKPVPWEKLPESYVKQIREAIEQQRATQKQGGEN